MFPAELRVLVAHITAVKVSTCVNLPPLYSTDPCLACALCIGSVLCCAAAGRLSCCWVLSRTGQPWTCGVWAASLQSCSPANHFSQVIVLSGNLQSTVTGCCLDVIQAHGCACMHASTLLLQLLMGQVASAGRAVSSDLSCGVRPGRQVCAASHVH